MQSKNVITYLSLFLLFIFSSCSNNTGPNNSSATLDAVITYSPQSPEAGTQVTLDASSSDDPGNIGFEAIWTLSAKPSGSNATIQAPDQVTTTFTPDVAGDYEISLEIGNTSEGVSDDAQSVITSVAVGAKELSGDINEDSTLVNIFPDPSVPDYIVTGNVDVSAVLTVDPGVVIYFQEHTGLTISNDGVIKAEGEIDNNIVLTGENQTTNGFWRGISIYSNTVENIISHAEISYGGSKEAGTYFDAANLTIDQAKVQLSDVTISHSGKYGIQTRRDESEFAMQNMTFENNDDTHAYVHISQLGYFDEQSTFDEGFVTAFGGGTTGDMDIDALDGAKYHIVDNVDFSHDITVAAGANFEFGPDAGIRIQNGSTIKAIGTSNDKIVFTGKSKVAGAWKGIFVSSSSVENVFEHVEISYGGSSDLDTYFDKANLGIDRARITLDNVSITGSAGYGIQTRRDESDFSVVNSSFDDNADSHMFIHATQIDFIDNQTNFNGGDVEVYSGDTEDTGSESWSNLNNGVFYFSGSVTIENEVSIEAGALFEMGTDVKLTVSRGTDPGVIKALGSNTAPIVFTGRSKAKGAWSGILITSGSIENEMEHVNIEYGGGTDLDIYMDAGNLGVHGDAYLSISNSTIENSANYGLIVRENRDAVISLSNVTYADNNNTDYYTY